MAKCRRVISTLAHYHIATLIRYLCNHIGHLLQSLLKGFGNHAFDERIEFDLDGNLHFALLFADGHQLNPQVERQRRTGRFELHQFARLTLNDAQTYVTHRRYAEVDGVGIELEVLNLVLGNTVFDLLQIVQVRDFGVNRFLTEGDYFNATFKCCHNYIYKLQITNYNSRTKNTKYNPFP